VSSAPVEHKMVKRQIGFAGPMPLNVAGFGGQLGFGG